MAKKTIKKDKTKVLSTLKKEEDEYSGGASLDDAFAGDDDVEYAPSKPRKEKKNKKDKTKVLSTLNDEMDDVEEEVEEISKSMNTESDEPVKIKASKPITKVKKGDRIKVDGKEYIVDAHEVLIDHGSTKEMAIEVYDKDDKDYQIRYFNDQVETTLQFYGLQEIMYIKKPMKEISW